MVFQSTLRRTERHHREVWKMINAVFQSTLRRTERQFQIRAQGPLWLFQSTLRRTERPRTCTPILSIFTISIHAPTNGATIVHGQIKKSILQFQSTLRRTERHSLNSLYSLMSYFNPRSDERSDHQHSRYNKLTRDFNPRSDERSDPLTDI